jgi:uncharacterized phage-associated protein
MLTASDVARILIARSREQGQTLSNSKLQCLLYYAQAWHLALFDRRLFADQIEAWESGPVMPLALENFNSLCSASDDDEVAVIDDWTEDHLDAMRKKYGFMSEEELRGQIQSEAPWLVARATPPDAGRSAAEIELNDMKFFYRYPASDIFVRVVYGLSRVLVKLRVYQAGLRLSRWVRKAWEGWKIICSFFCMTP